MVYTTENIRLKEGLVKAVRDLNRYDNNVVMLYWNNGYIDFKIESFAEACLDNREDKLFVINDGNRACEADVIYWIKDFINCWY